MARANNVRPTLENHQFYKENKCVLWARPPCKFVLYFKNGSRNEHEIWQVDSKFCVEDEIYFLCKIDDFQV